MEISYLMLGGNVCDRMDYLRRCIECLQRDAGKLIAVSAVYESEPWGFDDSCWFLNQAVTLETDLAPHVLLECTRQIEKTLGRSRIHGGYHARTIDIDILLYGNRIVNFPELVIPHPRMAERMFVLQPMTDLAPDLIHPVLHQSMAILKEQCTDKKQVKLFS